MPSAHRDISPLLQRMRNFLLGRKHTSCLRYQDQVANRTLPPPNLPNGPAHKLSKNAYCTRDARRLVKPPIDLLKQKLLSEKDARLSPKTSKLPTPGPIYRWD